MQSQMLVNFNDVSRVLTSMLRRQIDWSAENPKKGTVTLETVNHVNMFLDFKARRMSVCLFVGSQLYFQCHNGRSVGSVYTELPWVPEPKIIKRKK